MYKVVNKRASDDVTIMDESGKKLCTIVKTRDLTPMFFVYTCEHPLQCPVAAIQGGSRSRPFSATCGACVLADTANFPGQQSEGGKRKDHNGTPLYRWAVIQPDLCSSFRSRSKYSIHVSQDTARPLWFAEAQWSTGLQVPASGGGNNSMLCDSLVHVARAHTHRDAPSSSQLISVACTCRAHRFA